MKDDINALRFQHLVGKALEEVQKVLENTRNPLSPAEVHHTYDDKYVLVESTVNTMLSSVMNSFEPLGLQQEHLAKFRSWAAAGKSVQLSFEAQEECLFLRKEKRKEEPTTERVTTIDASFLPKMEFSSKTVKTITEWFWSFSAKYKLSCISGSAASPDDRVVIATRKCVRELKTLSDDAPWPKVHLVGPVEVPITWAMKKLSKDFVWEFSIDRAHEECHTPRRNPETIAARRFFGAIRGWADELGKYFSGRLLGFHEGYATAKEVSGSSIFSPVTPLFEAPTERAEDAAPPSGLSRLPSSYSCEPSVMLPVADIERLLHRQRESIEELGTVLGSLFTSTDFFTATEGMAASIFGHILVLSEAFETSIDFVETMIMQQVVAAVGKVLSPSDFANYMLFHNRKLFKEKFVPLPFSYAIRRPDRSPEGILSIESTLADGSSPDPIYTISRHSTLAAAMRFPIGAATHVSFTGDRYVHAWVGHQFSGSSGMSLHLAARARQFSSFILLIGNIAGATLFQPTYGIVIQNKDDLKVPLLLEQIPTPKEFRDAIESLSPEQQRFAKAFRAMQLESTLFGVAVIQTKPLLEKLLRLPEDSLTKEIRLVEDIQELFTKYQVPSDMLSYDGPKEVSVKEKVLSVRKNADAVLQMVEDIRQEELRIILEAKEAAEAEKRLREEMMLQATRELAEKAHRRHEQERKECEEKASVARRDRARRSGVGSVMSKGRGGARATGSITMASMSLDCAAPRLETAAARSRKPATRQLTSAVPKPARAAAPLAPSPVSNSQPSPAQSLPAKPSPAKPSPAKPSPAKPSPAKPAPVKPSPVEPSAVEPSPAEPSPAESEAVKAPVDDEFYQEFALAEDYTKIPARLDAKFEVLDEDSCLRPTIIKASNHWTKQSQASLLSKPVESAVGAVAQKNEKNRAFDLLDSLTKSGSVVIDRADFHVVIAATHCFDKALLETVVQDNINPIEKVERSTLIIATTIHDRAAIDLINSSRLDSCRATSPALFGE